MRIAAKVTTTPAAAVASPSDDRYRYHRYYRELYDRNYPDLLRERYTRRRSDQPRIFFGDIDAMLGAALSANGYFESSYYAVPNGFALVTRLEQIELDGSPKADPPRWSVEPFAAAAHGFSIVPYLRALFSAAPGYYRVIVFIVTSVPFGQSGQLVTRSQALQWLQLGFRWLPDSIAIQQYRSDTRTTALIYEFECKSNASARLMVPSRLSSRTHLVRSGIWKIISESP